MWDDLWTELSQSSMALPRVKPLEERYEEEELRWWMGKEGTSEEERAVCEEGEIERDLLYIMCIEKWKYMIFYMIIRHTSMQLPCSLTNVLSTVVKAPKVYSLKTIQYCICLRFFPKIFRLMLHLNASYLLPNFRKQSFKCLISMSKKYIIRLFFLRPPRTLFGDGPWESMI